MPSQSAPVAEDPAAQGPGLSDFLCFAVYSANLAFGRAYKPILEALGLTSYTQFIAIVARFGTPEQMRKKAMLSRWLGSMFACSLKTKPLNSESVGETTRSPAVRSGGGGARSA